MNLQELFEDEPRNVHDLSCNVWTSNRPCNCDELRSPHIPRIPTPALVKLPCDTDTARCVCGCPAEVHEHLRRGTDCGACGRNVCPFYRAGEVAS